MRSPSRLFTRFALASVLALGSLSTISGCDTPSATQAAEGSAEVSMQALSEADVASATISVSGPALTAPRTQTLFKRDGSWGVSLNGLPAGGGYTFTATAFDANGVAIYTGSVGNVTIMAKQSVPVNITANQVDAAGAFKNSAPVIDSLNISSTKVIPGDVVNLAVAAHDPDTGDTLTYAWSATGGTLGSAMATQTTWTAPTTEGTYDLTIVVQDNHGAKTSVKTAVKVDNKNGRGSADVTLTFNNAPVVMSVAATPGWLEKGTGTAVVATASDSDNSPLSYGWSSSCAGSFANSTSSSTTFTPADDVVASSCTLQVTVADGTGFSTTGQVTLPVGKPAFNSAPEIVNTVQSHTIASPGTAVVLKVEASDPDGDNLTFAWSASAGTVSAPVSDASSSQVTFTVPSSNAPWQVTVNVSDGKGNVTTQTFCVASPTTKAWKFGVMADTQWIGTDDGKNPNSVAVDIINHLNSEFIAKGVDLVVQVGDLTDNGSTKAMQTTAVFRQALYNAGIGFFPLRGNHESTTQAASDLRTLFPQTQTGLMNATPSSAFTGAANADYPVLPPVLGGSFAMGSNFSSPPAPLTGLTYSFDYKNVRMVLLDQFMKQDGTSASGNYGLDPQLPWVSSTLAGKPAGSHSFVFSHKGLITENHVDSLFGANPSVDPTGADTFINAMAGSNTHYLFVGHDHMYDRSIIGTALTGTGAIQQVLCASDSSKFYIPYGPNYQTVTGSTAHPLPNDDTYNLPAFGHKRQIQLAQELYTVGYYIVTVDGPRVKVDFYSAVVNPSYSSSEYLISTTPTMTINQRDTFGYSLNGKEFVVASAGSYSAVSDGYNGATLTMGGSNASTAMDSANRLLAKAVDTGWADGTCATASPIATVVGSTSPMYGAADARLVTLSFDPSRVSAADLASGHFGLAVRDAVSGNWVNAATSGTPTFVSGPANAAAPLGTYGIDTASNTAWAIVDHDGDFTVTSF
jgi:hypothetical protein